MFISFCDFTLMYIVPYQAVKTATYLHKAFNVKYTVIFFPKHALRCICSSCIFMTFMGNM